MTARRRSGPGRRFLGTRGDSLREEIAARGFVHATVTGSSMLPTLRAQDIVRLEPIDDPRPGHILAFEHGGGLLVHRVLRVAPDHLVCRGDNRVLDDGRTPREAVVGRAVEVFGPGRETGMRLRDDALALGVVRLALVTRPLRTRCRHVMAELALIVHQTVGRAQSKDLAGLDASSHVTSGSTDAEPPAASAFSSLGATERVALVRRLLEGRPTGTGATVRALALARTHRLARASACLRRVLRRVGVVAGEPGDTAWPTADGTGYTGVHLFTAAGFAAELEAAGAHVVEIRSEVDGEARVWAAGVTSRQPLPSRDAAGC